MIEVGVVMLMYAKNDIYTFPVTSKSEVVRMATALQLNVQTRGKDRTCAVKPSQGQPV